MVALNRGASCRSAEPYYYDFLLGPDNSAIPDSVVLHITDCPHCQEAVRRLGEAVEKSEPGAAGVSPKEDMGLIDALSLHFEYVGEYVTCARVKAFLPALAMPSAPIRIPTPITVHVDNCPRCAADLDTIRRLNLRTEQLARLSRLLGESPSEDSGMCRRAEASIAALGSGAPAGIEAGIRDHICTCPRCRADLSEYRRSVLTKQQAEGLGAGASACDGLDPAEIFDHVIPYGLAADEPESATAAHVWACPACLEKMQWLHRTLCDIAERADSDTATVYATKDEAASGRSGADGRYARYGIDVRVIRQSGAPAAGRRILRPGIKPFVKAAAMAALIPLVVVLLVHTRSASGTGPEDIINAFARADNVHIQVFYASQIEPVQERWVARREDAFMTTDGNGYTLYDVQARTKTIADSAGEITGPVVLDEREYAGVRSMMQDSLGFTLAGMPVDHEWRKVAQDLVEGTETYELTWTKEGGDGRSYHVKWEVAIDLQNKRPRQTGLFRRYSPESEWELQSQRKLEYPTEQAVRSAVAERFPTGAAAPI